MLKPENMNGTSVDDLHGIECKLFINHLHREFKNSFDSVMVFDFLYLKMVLRFGDSDFLKHTNSELFSQHLNQNVNIVES